MMNIKIVPAIMILAVISILLFVAFAVCQDKEEVPEAVFEFVDGSIHITGGFDEVIYIVEDPSESNEPNEPNEPEEILICPEHYKRYCKICESIVYRGGWLLPFKGSYLYNQALQEKPNELSELEILCSCGWRYLVMGNNLCYRKSFSIITNIPEPDD